VASDAIAQLTAAIEATGQLVDSVKPEQWASPTPCDGWTARDLLDHLVTGNFGFARAVSGNELAGPDHGDDIATAYHASARALTEAFGAPGALDRIVTVPFGTVPASVAMHLRITELLVHGWDLAKATGQVPDFPAEVAEQELAFSQAKVGELPSGRSPFAPPQPVPADAPAIDRLVALLGRTANA
jgi:uncharacterized protein (TIGR03086 family)